MTSSFHYLETTFITPLRCQQQLHVIIQGCVPRIPELSPFLDEHPAGPAAQCVPESARACRLTNPTLTSCMDPPPLQFQTPMGTVFAALICFFYN